MQVVFFHLCNNRCCQPLAVEVLHPVVHSSVSLKLIKMHMKVCAGRAQLTYNVFRSYLQCLLCPLLLFMIQSCNEF